MNATVLATKPSKPIEIIRSQLNLPAMRDQLRMALPPHVSLDKFLRVAITALQQNPDLLKADRNSLYAAIVSAAQLGLLPDSQLGEAYFVPFKGRVQLIPGYRGLIKLARQGDVGFVEAETIHENDDVSYFLGDDSKFSVQVAWRDRGAPIGVYAVAKFRDGGMCGREVLMKADIDVIRAKSQAANGPAWKDNYWEMAKKSAIRQLSKTMPLTTEARNAVRLSELHEELNQRANVIDGQVVPEEPEEKPEEEVQEPKRKPRKSVLDAAIATPPPQAEERPAPSSNDERPDLNVDPETGEILGATDDFFGHDDEQT